MTSCENMKEHVAGWWDEKHYPYVEFRLKEIFGQDPEDMNDEYRSKYEISFIPEDINQAAIFLLISREGYVGVGVENIERVERRVKKKIFGRIESAFIAGHQPADITPTGIGTLLDAAANGEFYLCFRYVPMIIFPRIGISKETSHHLLDGEYKYIDDFQIIEQQARGFLAYEPWK